MENIAISLLALEILLSLAALIPVAWLLTTPLSGA
jgi:hypothetical protein